MSIAALSSDAANKAAAPENPLTALTQFVPTEIVAVFVPGITTITSAFRYTGHMPFTWTFFGIDLTMNSQAFLAWSWFYLCLLLSIVYYLIGYITAWRRSNSGNWPPLRTLFGPYVIWQLAATLIASYLWGISVSPGNALLLPDGHNGIDARPITSVLALITAPLFAAINQMITVPKTSNGSA